jgi:hypothetical protein
VTALGLDGPHGPTNGEHSPGTMSTFWTSSRDPGCGSVPSPETSESPETASVSDPLPRMTAEVVNAYVIAASWRPSGTENAKLSTASELNDVPAEHRVGAESERKDGVRRIDRQIVQVRHFFVDDRCATGRRRGEEEGEGRSDRERFHWSPPAGTVGAQDELRTPAVRTHTHLRGR